MVRPLHPPHEIRSRLDVLETEDRISLARRVEVHDDNRVEIKFDYGVPPARRRLTYRLEIFFFFPGSLDLDSSTYPREQFYNDLSAYLRFKTPDLSVQELMDVRGELSPLARLRDLADELDRAPKDLERVFDQVQEEAKLFGCLYRTYLRSKAARLHEFVRFARNDSLGLYDRERLESGVARFHEKSRALLEGFREVRGRFEPLLDRLPKRIRAALSDVDEYLSFRYEQTFCLLLEAAEEYDDLLAERLRGLFLTGIRGERSYRRSRGSLVSPHESGPPEAYAHHLRLLKKFVGSALYLQLLRTAPSEKYNDWIGALAAGLAMLVATLAMYEVLGGANPRLMDASVLAAIVAIYILKDRIKELTKRFLAGGGLRWIPDFDTRIEDPRRRLVLGRCRESTRWIDTGRIPSPVEKIRRFHSHTHRELREATGESVLHYRKLVTVYPETIHAAYDRRADLNDILRLNVTRLRQNMDDPEMTLVTLDEESEALTRVTAPKTYSVNLVVRYGFEGRDPVFEKIRLVLDQGGLQRVETVVPPCPARDLANLGSSRAVEEWIRAHY